MSGDSLRPTSFRIGELFDELVDGLISAQKSLDENALEQKETFLLSPQESLSIPPLWFHFRRVQFDLEVKAIAVQRQASPSLTCQLINPVTSALIEPRPFMRSRISVAIEPMTQLSAHVAGGNDAD